MSEILVNAFDLSIQHKESLIDYTKILGFIIFVLGLFLYGIARFTIRKFFSEKLVIKPDHKLITQGIYRYIRHPIYLGEILMFVSIPIIFTSFYGLIIAIILIGLLVYRIAFEEELFLSKFGQEYIDYSSHTKKLIPFIF